MEEATLSPWATRSNRSRGRQQPEEPDSIRTAFQRDRDRILYTNAFRRLRHKTQVFIAPPSDHYTTRLAHTLEVAQIARTICRALRLNEDLAEAIALGHDLGHTPFGHLGEEELGTLAEDGFRHNVQSLRVVDVLERRGRGLNLTWEVRDGIVKHSKGRRDLAGSEFGVPATPEGQAVKLADATAYLHHDVEDAIRAGVLTESDLPPEARRLGASANERLDAMVHDIIDTSWGISEPQKAGKPANASRLQVAMSPAAYEAASALREFMFERVYEARSQRQEAGEARETVRFLFRYLLDHPDQLPEEYQPTEGQGPERRVVDYVAGMTDNFALRLACELRG
jgi:dGTPase